jgi:hypothetical protein
MTDSWLQIPMLGDDIPLSTLIRSSPAPITELRHLWNGVSVDQSLKTTLSAAWTSAFLYLLFECRYSSLNLSEKPQFREKTMGLWDRDVVEIFLAPDPTNPSIYREVEVSPLGEWLDVELQIKDGKRKSNWEWNSNVESVCRISDSIWKAAFRIPAKTLFGNEISAGQECSGNFYRCDGTEPDRHYITWQPTMTPEPAFHVPEKFGRIRFV